MLDKGQFKIGENEISVKSGPGKVGIFSTEFLLPSNSYQGKYYVRYFIFQNGEFLSYAENKIDLKQAGFSRSNMANSNKFSVALWNSCGNLIRFIRMVNINYL